jgi:nitrile hydratase accessory protein
MEKMQSISAFAEQSRNIPDMPVSGDEPVFQQPWEARIFAIVVDLNQQGAFEWKAFQALLIDEVRQSESTGQNRDYYENWFAAAERLIHSLGIAQEGEVDAEVARLRPDDRTIVLPKQ